MHEVGGRRRVAWIVPEGPGFQRGGQNARNDELRRHLEASGFDVTVFVPSGRVRRVVHRDGDPLGARTPGEVALFGSWRVARPRVAAVAIAWRLFHRSPRRVAMLLDRARTSLRRRRGTDYSLGSWMNGAQVEWLRDALDALQPEAVLATIIFSAPPIDVLPASARHRVLFAEECFSDRHASFEAQGYRVQPPELGPVAEQRILEQWPLVVAIQREEAVRLAEIAPGTTVVTIAPTRTVRVADAAATIDGRVLPKSLQKSSRREISKGGRTCRRSMSLLTAAELPSRSKMSGDEPTNPHYRQNASGSVACQCEGRTEVSLLAPNDEVYRYDVPLRITASSGQTVSVTVTTKSGARLALLMTDAAGTSLGQAIATAANGNVTLEKVAIPASGTYYLTVLDGTGIPTKELAFEITFQLAAATSGTTLPTAGQLLTATGLQFKLSWDTVANLDLEVRDPVGGSLFWETPTVPTVFPSRHRGSGARSRWSSTRWPGSAACSASCAGGLRARRSGSARSKSSSPSARATSPPRATRPRPRAARRARFSRR